MGIWIPGDPEIILRAAREFLTSEHQAFSERRDEISTFGMTFHAKRSGDKLGVRGEIDAVVLSTSLLLIDAMLNVTPSLGRVARVTIMFQDHVKAFPEPHKISARLLGCNVAFSADGGLEIERIPTKISRNTSRGSDGTHVNAVVTLDVRTTISEVPVIDIVDLLFEREVLVAVTGSAPR